MSNLLFRNTEWRERELNFFPQKVSHSFGMRSLGNCELFIYCGYSEWLGHFPGVKQLEVADKGGECTRPPLLPRCVLWFTHSFSPSSIEEQLLRADAGEMEMDLKSPRVAGSWDFPHQAAWPAFLFGTGQACHEKTMDLMTHCFL